MKKILSISVLLLLASFLFAQDKTVGGIPELPTVDDSIYLLTIDGVWKKFSIATLKQNVSGQVTGTSILYVPALTGNVNNRNEFVTDPADDVWFIDIDGNAKKLSVGGGGIGGIGNAVSLTDTITQASHGFTLLQPISTLSSAYTGADTTNFAVGVISSVIDANNFVISYGGKITATAHGKTIDSIYYTPNATGQAVLSASVTSISQPVYRVIDANTIQVQIFRPASLDILSRLTPAEVEAFYNQQVSIVTQVEAEAGTSTTVRRWTSERVKQAILALAGGGVGDMTKAVYDPTNINSSAFDMDNMVEGATTKILTDTERTSIGTIASKLASVVAGTNITVDNTDPQNPIISSAGGAADGNGMFDGSGMTPTTTEITLTDFINFDANTLYIKGSSNQVGFGIEPTHTVDINGTMKLGGLGYLYDNIGVSFITQSANTVSVNRDCTIGNALYGRAMFNFKNYSHVTGGASHPSLGGIFHNIDGGTTTSAAGGTVNVNTGTSTNGSGVGGDFIATLGTGVVRNGRFGIGTSSPTARLDVVGGMQVKLGNYIFNTDQTLISGDLTYNSTSGEIELQDNFIYANWRIPTGGNELITGTTSAVTISTQSGNSADWTFSAGVFTKTVQSEHLHLSGSITISTLTGGSETHIALYKNGILAADSETMMYTGTAGAAYTFPIGFWTGIASSTDTFEIKIWQDVADNITIQKMSIGLTKI